MSEPLFSRYPLPVCFEGIQAETLEVLNQSLALRDSDTLLCTDLSLGAWYGNQAAREFASQLKIMITEERRPTGKTGFHARDLEEDSDTIGLLIDRESSGDQLVSNALINAEKIRFSLTAPTTFIVFVPRFGSQWRRQDSTFLTFLNQALKGTEHRLLLVSSDSELSKMPAGWSVTWSRQQQSPPSRNQTTSLLPLIPGLISRDVLEMLGPGTDLDVLPSLALPGNLFALAPELRRPISQIPASKFDALSAHVHSCEWLRTYAVIHGNATHLDPEAITISAGIRSSEGAIDIALDLLRRNSSAEISPTARAASLLQEQSLRIASLDFCGAAGSPDPPEEVPAGLRAALFQCKGWGLVMTNRAREAESYFDSAIQMLSPWSHSRYYLYLANIAALNKLRLGNSEAALALEKEIEKMLDLLSPPDWHLRYINWLNLARVYKARGELKEAEEHYALAFSTHLGLRSDSDLIYVNLCRAQLFAMQGNDLQAWIAWFRTSLHWLATPVPEALAPRVASAILGTRLGGETYSPEQISAALRRNLTHAAQLSGIPPSDNQALSFPAPTFIRSTTDSPQVAIGSPGWGILVRYGKSVPPAFRGVHSDALRQEIAWYMERICGDGALDAKRSATIIVDTQLGHDVPATAAELLGTCIRYRTLDCRFGQRKVLLTTGDLDSLERMCRLKLSPAVRHARTLDDSTLEVSYRRYRPAVQVDPYCGNLLRSIGEDCTVESLLAKRSPAQSEPRVLHQLRELEKLRLIEFLPPGIQP